MVDEVLPLLLIALVARLPDDLKQAQLAILLQAEGAAEENLVLKVVLQILILLSQTLI